MLNKKRYNSSIINLRVFHNWIKNSMYSKISKSLREKYNKKDIKILELAVGKGGDLFKWIGIEADEVVGVDIDEKSVFGKNGALHRYKRKLKQKQPGEKIPKCFFYVDDLTKPNSFKNMKEKLKNKKFNIISCQFAVHYFFESEVALKNIVQIIDHFLETDGYFIGTTMDPNKICSLFPNEDKNKVDKDSFSIELKTDIKNSKSPYNNKYVVSLGEKNEDHYFSEKPSTEYLINKSELETKLKNTGVNLIEYEKFNDHYKKYLETGPDHKMTKGEQEFSFLNLSFIFQKIGKDKI